ncbi:tRNA lysidine(34) synthetase TilS [Nocardiopsis sp. NRRL B-16309]|uniref:tRNA lysidine(34) synthetase TilS n=1 Tax=Nocardiopsis sp. NRRL B-16309 TaxID=1519494 RepID=UPI0006AF2235|nr:tRNA lysidine(34) synthetase TilS [Nocardiopsis sp. NRRL B-16309]
MSGPHPAVAAVRSAVRRALADLPADTTVLAACSGGADSLALSGALAFEAPRAGRRAGGVTVDHGLQEGSAARAAEVAGVLRGLGLDPVLVREVEVDGPGGPEAAARRARYAALDGAVRAHAPAVVLLGHTLDDQAETVLLGLARGSGARSLAGMAPRNGHHLRPLLGLDRSTVRRACVEMGLRAWEDPHNHDPRFARSRVRHEALPALEKALGPGIAEALARTAALLRADADTLDRLADDLLAEAVAEAAPADGPTEAVAEAAPAVGPTETVAEAAPAVGPTETVREVAPGGGTGAGAAEAVPKAVPAAGLTESRTDAAPTTGTGPGAEAPRTGPALRVDPLAAAPASLRTRVLRRAALAAGCAASALTARHVRELDRLVTDWRGQSHIDLPGGVRCRRVARRLRFEP